MSEKSTLKHINVIIHSIIYLLSLKMQWSQRTRERSVNSEIPGSLPSLFPQLSLSKFWTLFFCPGVPTNTAGTYDTAGTSQSHCWNLSHCPLAMSSTPHTTTTTTHPTPGQNHCNLKFSLRRIQVLGAWRTRLHPVHHRCSTLSFCPPCHTPALG